MIVKCLKDQLAIILKKVGDIVNEFISLAENLDRIQQAKIAVSDIARLETVFVFKKIWNQWEQFSETIPKILFLKNTFSSSGSNIYISKVLWKIYPTYSHFDFDLEKGF